MALLEQQELLEAPPARRLIVPHGHTAWWGVDVSTKRVSIGWVDAALNRGVRTVSFPALDGGRRFATIYADVGLLVNDLRGVLGAPSPGVVLVEQPAAFGRPVEPNLQYAVGATLGGVYAALAARDEACRVETVPVGHWKRLATGKGNLKKPNRRKGDTFEYGVLTWARRHGYAGALDDEADALAIAEAARREYALEER